MSSFGFPLESIDYFADLTRTNSTDDAQKAFAGSLGGAEFGALCAFPCLQAIVIRRHSLTVTLP